VYVRPVINPCARHRDSITAPGYRGAGLPIRRNRTVPSAVVAVLRSGVRRSAIAEERMDS